MPQALQPHGEWIGISVNIISAAYNTNLVKPDEVPKSYDDLKQPDWKGRLAIEADDVDWFAAVVSKLGEEHAGSNSSATSCAPTACRRARAIRCSPTWWRPARCRSR